ncbi:unnamed protein product [Symbiodinium sp. CCMP2592]|nr:unnamed protein product [Symbiodinium sp. CCMP2592]
MNHYMCSCLPYVLGGGLYPAHFHIGTHDNVADDPSRLKALREPCDAQSLWLERLLLGDYRHFDLVRRADDCVGAPGKWARLVMLKLLCDWDAKVNLDATGGLSNLVAQRRGLPSSGVCISALGLAFAAALLLGFHGLLRPGEFLKLRRRDLILPCDLLTSTPIAYVRILGAKTKRFLQHQRAKISDVLAVRFLEALYGPSPRAELLFNCSPSVFRRRWDYLFQHLGVPVGDNERGITPKCLRGSGATWLYQMTEDIGRIQWRGRWQQRRTLEHYLQDVAGQLLLTDLTESQRSVVLELAPFAATLLSLYESKLLRT